MTKLRSLSASCVFVATFSPLSVTHAHHGAANYDRTREVVVEGVVAKVGWRNPHISTIEVAGERGEPVLQEVEGGSISVLSPLGLTRDSLTLGERVTVRALPHRRGPGLSVLGSTRPGPMARSCR